MADITMNSSARPSDAADVERLGHVTRQLCELWGRRDLDAFVQGLVLDSRDGARQGLPPAIAQELLLLADINKDVRAMHMADRTGLDLRQARAKIEAEDSAASAGDAFDNPLVSRDTLSSRRDETGSATKHPVAETTRRKIRPSPPSFGDVFLGLLINKYVISVVVLGVLAKTFWPAIKQMLGLG